MAREAHRAAFPIKGVDCVGCMLTKHIEPTVRFVKEHMDSMSEDSLWKQAALCYMREVQEPRKREGVLTPNWGWKDIRSHFLLHVNDHTIARASTCRQLQTMRFAVEQRLMRTDGNEKELDRAGCDLILKIISAESKERTLLQSAQNGSSSGGGRRGQGGSTVGDAK